MPARPAVIVADDLGFVGMLRERLKQAGCRPIWARDAREALVAITDERPAIVIIDVGVPRVRGLELLAKLDRRPMLARIPRVVLSSSDQDLEGRIELANHRPRQRAQCPRQRACEASCEIW